MKHKITVQLTQAELIALAVGTFLKDYRVTHGADVEVNVEVVPSPYARVINEVVTSLVKEVARGDNRISMIRDIRELTNMNLRDSKAIVDAYVPHRDGIVRP